MRLLAVLGALLVGVGLTMLVSHLSGLVRRRTDPLAGLDLSGWGPARAPGSLRVGGVSSALDARFGGLAHVQRLAVALPRAGWGDRGVGHFVVATGVGASVIGAMVATVTGPWPGLVAAALAAGIALQVTLVRSRRWLRRFEAELPDALDLLSGSLEAGSPLSQAMTIVAAEGRPPLADEFHHILSDTQLGRPLADAMHSAAERIGSRDFAWCVRAVATQQELGASLSGLLRTLAEFMRWRQELKGEVSALTAEGRLSAYILCGLPFLVAGFFALVNPSYLGLLVTTAPGLFMLVTAAVLLTIGSMWMSRIVKIEV